MNMWKCFLIKRGNNNEIIMITINEKINLIKFIRGSYKKVLNMLCVIS
jgi:hypothetical protein